MAGAEQRMLQDVLHYAVSASSQEGNHNTQPIRNEDRAWLEEAMSNYAGLLEDPVQCLKKNLSTIHRFLHPTQEEDKKIETDNVHDALVEIREYCEDFDLARNLHQLGGFDIMIQCLQFPDVKMRKLACTVLGNACQNHEYCQNSMLEMNGLRILINVFENASSNNNDDNSLRLKSLFALSCLVRGNKVVQRQFEDNGGFSIITKAMQSANCDLKMKAIFFIRALCKEDSNYAKRFHDSGVEIQVIATLKDCVHSMSADENSEYEVDMEAEDILKCLWSLIKSCQDIKIECSNPSYELASLLEQLKKQCSSLEDSNVCVKQCDKIYQYCFGDDSADDR